MGSGATLTGIYSVAAYINCRGQNTQMKLTKKTLYTHRSYEQMGSDATLTGIYSVADMRRVGKEKGWCPYFFARHLIGHCNVVV
jgi:hypothetical protein